MPPRRTAKAHSRARVAYRKVGRLSAKTGYTRKVGFYGRYNKMGSACGETKFHDITLSEAPTVTGGAITDTLVEIVQGVTESRRVGRKAFIKSIQWNYDIELPALVQAAVPLNGDCVRIILFCDKQCNGAAAGVTDILESATIHSFRNLVNSGRFRVLMDKRHTINYSGLASNATDLFSQIRVLKCFSRSFKMSTPIEYNSTTGAITEIRSNNFGVLIISEKGVAHFHSSIRVRFTD